MSDSITAFLNTLVHREFVAIYQLIEWSFIATGAYMFFYRGCWNVRYIRGLIPSVQTNQMLEVGIGSIFANLFAGLMLMSFGESNAYVANTLFLNANVAPYDETVFASLTCASGMTDGCLGHDIGVFQANSFSGNLLSTEIFNFVIGLLQLMGASAYGNGWVKVGKIMDPQPQQQITFRMVATQILLGAAMMHPREFHSWFL